jgi:hypothetical protein
MDAVKKTMGVTKKKATSDGWISCIEKSPFTLLALNSKGNTTPQHSIVGVKMLNEALTTATNPSPIIQDLLADQSMGSKLKSPTVSQKKRWAAYNNTGSPEVTVSHGKYNL